MTPPLNTPDHLWLPPTRDETAPRSLPIRAKELDPDAKRFLRSAAYVGGYRYLKSGIVKPDDLAAEIGWVK